MIRVLTYATHEDGYFRRLVENEHGVHVEVLGMHTKWRGFMDKIRGMRAYCGKLDANDLVVFADGFDSLVVRSTATLRSTFESFDCDVLISRDPDSVSFVQRRIFGSYDVICNSGLYMGRASKLVELFDRMESLNMEDDQRAMNRCAHDDDRIKIDLDARIFKNHGMFDRDLDNHGDAYFVSFPGGATLPLKFKIRRYVRGLRDHSRFFKRELSVTAGVVALAVVALRRKARASRRPRA